MKQKIISNFKWLSLSIILGLVFGGSLAFVRAWTEPNVAPPGGNLGAPINTGSSNQTKTGGYIKVEGGSRGLIGKGTTYGVRGKDSDHSGYGYLGYGNYGVRGYGDGVGVYGKETEYGSKGYLGLSRYGVYAIGSGNRGLYSRDEDGSSWTHLNYANYGIYTNSSMRGKRVYVTDYKPSSNRELASKWYVDRVGGRLDQDVCRWYSSTRRTRKCANGWYMAGTYMGVGGGGDDRLERIMCCRSY